jgi:hypothetical protein
MFGTVFARGWLIFGSGGGCFWLGGGRFWPPAADFGRSAARSWQERRLEGRFLGEGGRFGGVWGRRSKSGKKNLPKKNFKKDKNFEILT